MMYGLTEKQFRNLFERAKRKKGVTGEVFLTMLETRLDNVVYRLGFAKTRQAARQFVNHGHILVNGIKVDIASYKVSVGDEIGVREKTSSRQLATRNLEGSQYHPSPPWVEVNADSLQGTVSRFPQSDELEKSVNVQLVVEFYSR
jgi:small subunit ribosomal protein S4